MQVCKQRKKHNQPQKTFVESYENRGSQLLKLGPITYKGVGQLGPITYKGMGQLGPITYKGVGQLGPILIRVSK